MSKISENLTISDFAKNRYIGYFLTLINNIRVRNLKKIVVTLQKGALLRNPKIQKNMKKPTFVNFAKNSCTHEFFEIFNPDIIDQRQKIPYVTIF